MESSKTSDISEIQLGAKYVENVSIENCSFIINEIEEHKTTGITNIWFHTGWKNISINSCKVINYGKTENGGSIYFSDELGNKCENLAITNCYVDEKSGDESIAFWGDNLSNIRFESNTVMDNNDNKHNSMLIRIGTINNVSIYNNNLETTSYGSLIKIGQGDGDLVKDVNIERNIIKYNKILGNAPFNLFEVISGKQASNINVIENKINIESELTELVNSSSIITGDMNFIGNEVECNYNLAAISWTSFGEISNNKIKINGVIKNLFVYIRSNNKSDDILIRNNNIAIEDINEWTYLEKSFLLLQEVEIGDRKIEVSNNTVATNSNEVQCFVNFNAITDNISRTVYSYNNKLSIFSYIKNYNNLVEHKVDSE